MCGICGIFLKDRKIGDEAVSLVLSALFELGHRGDHSTGFAVSRNKRIRAQVRVGDATHLRSKTSLGKYRGNIAIGHGRYATDGSDSLANGQPMTRRVNGSEVSLAHNGQISWVHHENGLVTVDEMRKKLSHLGVTFQGDADSEILIPLLAQSDSDSIAERVSSALRRVVGTYALAILWDDHLIAACDPLCNRPLALGELPENKGYMFVSESCVFGHLNIKHVGDVNAGEMVIINPKGDITRHQFAPKENLGHCSFCNVYFARHDSTIFGQQVGEVRRRFGYEVAQEAIRQEVVVGDEIVVAVLDSGKESAMAVADCVLRLRIKKALANGAIEQLLDDVQPLIPLRTGLTRAHMSRRNFLLPDDVMRQFNINLKHAPNPYVLKGQRVLLVDDSLVRGTSMQALVKGIKNAGATWVGVLIASPPIKGRCHMGINIRSRGELIAATRTTEQVRDAIGADHLCYLSMEGFRKSLGSPENFCMGCFDGNYPIAIPPAQ